MLKRKSEALECSYEARKPAFCGWLLLQEFSYNFSFSESVRLLKSQT
jgi:hypothetical protein